MLNFSGSAAIAALAVILTVPTPASAQQRTLNTNGARSLRLWPVSGYWQAEFLRNSRHELRCIMATGAKQGASDYLWGIVSGKSATMIFIGDTNPTALSGNTIKLSIDTVAIGSYPITARRPMLTATGQLIESRLPTEDVQKIETLLATGGHVSMKTQGAIYEQSLSGSQVAMDNFHACNTELQALSGNSK